MRFISCLQLDFTRCPWAHFTGAKFGQRAGRHLPPMRLRLLRLLRLLRPRWQMQARPASTYVM